MGRQPSYDRDALHRVLWRRVDRYRRITFKSQDLAADLGISPYHFSRIVAEFQGSGRMVCVNTGKHSIKTYQVVDPEEWASLRQATRPLGPY